MSGDREFIFVRVCAWGAIVLAVLCFAWHACGR